MSAWAVPLRQGACMGRRMAEGVALLVHHVLPKVAAIMGIVVPGPLAVRLGYDAKPLAMRR